jgi:hypothetical protein
MRDCPAEGCAGAVAFTGGPECPTCGGLGMVEPSRVPPDGLMEIEPVIRLWSALERHGLAAVIALDGPPDPLELRMAEKFGDSYRECVQ